MYGTPKATNFYNNFGIPCGHLDSYNNLLSNAGNNIGYFKQNVLYNNYGSAIGFKDSFNNITSNSGKSMGNLRSPWSK